MMGVCLDDGLCIEVVDCSVEGNIYIIDFCVGSLVCSMGACMMDCSSLFVICDDLSGINFGECDMFLGWVVFGGICVVFSGCDNKGYIFYDSLEVCEVVCGDLFG